MRSVGHEHRHLAAPDDFVGNAPEQVLRKLAVFVSPHHDQLRPQLGSGPLNNVSYAVLAFGALDLFHVNAMASEVGDNVCSFGHLRQARAND